MLTKYIKKSKLVALLNAFNVDEIPLDSMNLADLLEPLLPQTHKQNLARMVDAVKTGNVDNPIFDDEKAEFYLVYLYLTHQYLSGQIEPEQEVYLAGFIKTLNSIEHKQGIASLNKEEFIQSYIYLMGKKEYQDDLQIIIAGNTTDADSSRTLTAYAKKLHANYPGVTETAILDRISELSGINKSFMLVRKKPQNDALLVEALIHPAGSLEQTATPATEISHNGETWIIIPPIELITWLAKQCNPSHQIEMEPCLGIIGTDTLHRDFHLKNKRPVTLASTHVAKNLTMAHGLTSSALSIPAHDIYFHFMALALFPHNGFRFITEVILPELKMMEHYEEHTSSKEVQQQNIKKLIEFINDFAMESDTKVINDISPMLQISQYLNAAMIQDKASFFIFMQLIPIVNSRIIELNNAYDLDCSSLMQMIYLLDKDELADLIPQLVACGSAHALDTYNALVKLKENDLYTVATSEMIFQNKEYSLQLANSLIAFNKHPLIDPSLLIQIAQSGIYSSPLTELYKNSSPNEQSIVSKLVSIHIPLPNKEHVASTSLLDALILLKNHPTLFTNHSVLNTVAAASGLALRTAERLIALNTAGIALNEQMMQIIERTVAQPFAPSTLIFLCNHSIELAKTPELFDYLLSKDALAPHVLKVYHAQRPESSTAFISTCDALIEQLAKTITIQGAFTAISDRFNLINSETVKNALLIAAENPIHTAQNIATVLYANYALNTAKQHYTLNDYRQEHSPLLSNHSFISLLVVLIAHNSTLSQRAIDLLSRSQPLEQLNLTNLTVSLSKFIELEPQLLSNKAIEYFCSLPQGKNLGTQPTMAIYSACKKLNDLIKTASQSNPNSLFASNRIPQPLIRELITSLCEGKTIEQERWQQLQQITRINSIMEPIIKKFPLTVECPSSAAPQQL